MKGLIAYCGLDCISCPIYLAGRETDKTKKDSMIAEIISQCREIYGVEYKYEDISECDGCRSECGKLFAGCNDCRIRKCASGKNLPDCAHCGDFACDILSEFFLHDPGAKNRLNEIRKHIS